MAINGTCLTAVKKEQGVLVFEAIPQTLQITNLGLLRVSDQVNLERSLKVGDRVSGHFVMGHIDCMGFIRRRSYLNNNLCLEVAVPCEFMKYVLPKGSVAIDGVSLTIVTKRSNTFSVYIIPHTLKNTTLGFKGPSDKVNLEFDILAKQTLNRC
jgi:riboflavin synthase